MKCYSLGFMFSAECDEVLLIRKNRPSWQAGKLNGIGGHIEVGEEHLQTMVREFREEAGVVQTDWEYVCTMHRPRDFRCYVFRAFAPGTLDETGFKTMTDEQVVKVSLPLGSGVAAIPNLGIIGNLHWLIPMCLDFNTDGAAYSVTGTIRPRAARKEGE